MSNTARRLRNLAAWPAGVVGFLVSTLLFVEIGAQMMVALNVGPSGFLGFSISLAGGFVSGAGAVTAGGFVAADRNRVGVRLASAVVILCLVLGAVGGLMALLNGSGSSAFWGLVLGFVATALGAVAGLALFPPAVEGAQQAPP
jgi:hypothetical protein